MTTLDCCDKPAQTNMHEFKHVLNSNGRYQAEPCWNRICSNCYTHWYGHPENLKKYTRKQWDEMIEKAINE